jgi:hypothetical protein
MMTDASSGKVPVVACVTASWRFLQQNWRQFLPAALITAAVSGVVPALFVAAAGPSPPAVLMGMAVQIIAGVFFLAAVLRKAVRDEFIAPTGLTLGQDETRLLALVGSYAIVFVPFILLFGIIFTVVVFGQSGLTPEELETMANDPEASNAFMARAIQTPAGITVCLIGFIAYVLISARLSMVNAATIGERKVVFFQTWGWTKGNLFRVLAAIVLTGLPAALVSVIAAQALGGLSSGSAGLVLAAFADSVLALLGAMLSIPSGVLGAELYKGLRPPAFVAK